MTKPISLTGGSRGADRTKARANPTSPLSLARVLSDRCKALGTTVRVGFETGHAP